MRRSYRAVTILAVAAAALATGATAAAAPAAGHAAKAALAGNVTLYSARVFSTPEAMTAGPDGALWYANFLGNSIGRITTTGHVKSAFHAPSIRHLAGIAAGPDGALWFTNYLGNSIGRITTTGQVTTYPAPGAYNPGSIAAGPGGAIWFGSGNALVGRITTR